MSEQPWNAQMVAERLEEAVDTLRRLPVKDLKPMGFRASWPVMLQDLCEADGPADVRVKMGPPTSDAIDRMDEVMEWLRWLEPDDVQLLWLRAELVPWKMIMRKLGKIRSTLVHRRNMALARIAVALNRYIRTRR